MHESSYHTRAFGRAVALACLSVLLFPVFGLAQQDKEQIDVPILRLGSYKVPDNLTLQVRLERITPEEATAIQ